MRVTQEQYKKFLNNSINAKQSKYHNKKAVYDGIKFDSIKEKSWYIKYKLMQQAGEIHNLQLQVPFCLIETFKLNNKTYRKTTYKADFTYYDKDNNYHVIDVKSPATKTKVYELKKKLMAWKYGIEVEEV